MTFNFTPSTNTKKIVVPFLEDARADFAPYYSTTKPISRACDEVSAEMLKLGGMVTAFIEGIFEDGELKRHGYEIRFMYAGQPGIIRVAGLPIRKETEKKVLQVKAQALLNVRDWLTKAITAQVFTPGMSPLIAHLLLPDGKTTVNDYIREQADLPLLNSSRQQIRIEKP